MDLNFNLDFNLTTWMRMLGFFTGYLTEISGFLSLSIKNRIPGLSQGIPLCTTNFPGSPVHIHFVQSTNIIELAYHQTDFKQNY